MPFFIIFVSYGFPRCTFCSTLPSNTKSQEIFSCLVVCLITVILAKGVLWYCTPATADFIFYICMLFFCYLFLQLHYPTKRSKAKFYMQPMWCRNMLITPQDHVYLLHQKETSICWFKSTTLACSHIIFQKTKKNCFHFLILKSHFCFPSVHEQWTDILAEQSIINPKYQSWVLTV